MNRVHRDVVLRQQPDWIRQAEAELSNVQSVLEYVNNSIAGDEAAYDYHSENKDYETISVILESLSVLYPMRKYLENHISTIKERLELYLRDMARTNCQIINENHVKH